jgi:hypothetical protein
LPSVAQASQGKGNLQMMVHLLPAREAILGRHRLSARHLQAVGASAFRLIVWRIELKAQQQVQRKSGTAVSGHPTMRPSLEKTKQSGKSQNSVLDGSPFHVELGRAHEGLWT